MGEKTLVRLIWGGAHSKQFDSIRPLLEWRPDMASRLLIDATVSNNLDALCLAIECGADPCYRGPGLYIANLQGQTAQEIANVYGHIGATTILAGASDTT